MSNIQEIIKLCQEEKGKVFVLDANGNISLVVLGLEEYQKILSRPTRPPVDPESVNKQILRAQLEEISAPEQTAKSHPPRITQERTPAFPRIDMREEVIDPSFDFED